MNTKLKPKRHPLVQNLWQSLLMMLLLFPMVVPRVNAVDSTVEWRWLNALVVFAATYGFMAIAWLLKTRKQSRRISATTAASAAKTGRSRPNLTKHIAQLSSRQKNLLYLFATVLLLVFPFVFSSFEVTIATKIFIFAMLALGLNVVVGIGGMLHLGYIAFFAIGAYTYGILQKFAELEFWIALPIGGIVTMAFGFLLALPVLRLRGDYLAIVTLAFGEIVRIFLENLSDITGGPGGISGMSRPFSFGLQLNYFQQGIFMYFIAFVFFLIIVVVNFRFKDSRTGRALLAMREDEIAGQAMGINLSSAKMTAFAVGAFIAGIAGVIFAASNTFISPKNFRLMESVMILVMVVLGGIGSIPGVIFGAVSVTYLSEHLLRFIPINKQLLFGIILVVMMLFKPAGLFPERRKRYDTASLKMAGASPPDPQPQEAGNE